MKVTGGMAGMIIVEDPIAGEFAAPPHLQAVSCPDNCENEVQLLFQPTLQYINEFGRGYANIQCFQIVWYRNCNSRYCQNNFTFRC